MKLSNSFSGFFASEESSARVLTGALGVFVVSGWPAQRSISRGATTRVGAGAANKDPTKIAISAWPLMSTLSYSDQNVNHPHADLATGYIRTTWRVDGGPFDWQGL